MSHKPGRFSFMGFDAMQAVKGHICEHLAGAPDMAPELFPLHKSNRSRTFDVRVDCHRLRHDAGRDDTIGTDN